MSDRDGRKIIARNRRAFHDYHVEDRLEAGIVLKGTEVKSLREGNGSIAEAYAAPIRGELWLIGAHIAEYSRKGHVTHEPTRDRKLLVHKRQLRRLAKRVDQEGMTLVPLSLYFNERNYAKVELGVCKGKTHADKRQAKREKDHQREIERQMSRHRNR